jgi:hypothetical protein
MVEAGSLWSGNDKCFRVLSVTEVDGHTWVHYREDRGIKVPAIECREYSCYLESFVARFRQLPE